MRLVETNSLLTGLNDTLSKKVKCNAEKDGTKYGSFSR